MNEIIFSFGFVASIAMAFAFFALILTGLAFAFTPHMGPHNLTGGLPINPTGGLKKDV